MLDYVGREIIYYRQFCALLACSRDVCIMFLSFGINIALFNIRIFSIEFSDESTTEEQKKIRT